MAVESLDEEPVEVDPPEDDAEMEPLDEAVLEVVELLEVPVDEDDDIVVETSPDELPPFAADEAAALDAAVVADEVPAVADAR